MLILQPDNKFMRLFCKLKIKDFLTHFVIKPA